LCLQPLEFVCVRKLQDKFEKSTCILSEFAGNSRSLGGAIITNPYDIENISNAIDEAVNMNTEQRQQRMEQSFEWVMGHSTKKWAHNFLD